MAKKKVITGSVEQKRQMIESGHQQVSIRHQCELLGLNRASYYYQEASESPLNLKLMRLIDEQYIKTPFYGWPRMTDYLQGQAYDLIFARIETVSIQNNGSDANRGRFYS